MPYSGPADESLPSDVAERSLEEREAFVETFNSVWEDCMEDGRTNESTCEERANAIARSAANEAGKGESIMSNETKARIITSRVSDTPWGQIDKTQIGNRAAEMYEAGDITKAQIREIWLVVPDDAFGEDDDDNPRFFHTNAFAEHHELSTQGNIVLNRAGLGAAAAAIGGARAEPDLSGQQITSAKRHLRRHYRDDLDMDREEMPDSIKTSEKADLVDGWSLVKEEGDEDPTWIKAMQEELEDYEEWAAKDADMDDVEVIDDEPVSKTEPDDEADSELEVEEEEATKADPKVEPEAESGDEKMHGDYPEAEPAPFGGATSLESIEAYKEAEEKEREFAQLWYHFQVAKDNIESDYMMEDDEKRQALMDLLAEFRNRLGQMKSISIEAFIDAMKWGREEEVAEIAKNADNLLQAVAIIDSSKVGRRHRSGDMQRVQKAHDLMGELGANCKMSHVPEEEMKKFLERANTPPELRKSDNGHDSDSQQLFSFKHLIQVDPVPE